MCLDSNAFLQRSWGWGGLRGGVHSWLQAASQEPAASFLSQGAASTAQMLGLPLVQWVGKPEGRYPVFCTLAGHADAGWVFSVAFSPDGKRVVIGSSDGVLSICDAATGAEVNLNLHSPRVSCSVLRVSYFVFRISC